MGWSIEEIKGMENGNQEVWEVFEEKTWREFVFYLFIYKGWYDIQDLSFIYKNGFTRSQK